MRAYWLAERSEMPNSKDRCSGSGRPVSASCRIRSRRMRLGADAVGLEMEVGVAPSDGAVPRAVFSEIRTCRLGVCGQVARR